MKTTKKSATNNPANKGFAAMQNEGKGKRQAGYNPAAAGFAAAADEG